MFGLPRPTGLRIPLVEVEVNVPCTPTRMIALWNNFHQLTEKLGAAPPSEPLHLLKLSNSFVPQGARIEWPGSYPGKVVFEGELGIVIGRRCRSVDDSAAAECILGCTCVNDVTAVELIPKDSTLSQGVRAKGPDIFGPFGPVIVTDLDPAALRVQTLLNGDDR